MIILHYDGDPTDAEMVYVWLSKYDDQIRFESLKCIEEALDKNLQVIQIVELHGNIELEEELSKKNEDFDYVVLDLKRNYFKTWLNDNLNWFIEKEHYEEASKIKELLQRINDSKK